VSVPPDQRVRKRSVTLAGHRTSLSLENEFWQALKAAAQAERLSLNALIERIDRERSGNLSSAVRVYLLHRAQRQGTGNTSAATGREPL
jgi:predicted DNA-binding ribbon-helix-helix protein